jgi:hypothetical protein
MQAMGEKAKLIEGQTDEYPDYATLAQYAQTAASTPSTTQLATQGLSSILQNFDWSSLASKVYGNSSTKTTPITSGTLFTNQEEV